jgi:hypothetical protein
MRIQRLKIVRSWRTGVAIIIHDKTDWSGWSSGDGGENPSQMRGRDEQAYWSAFMVEETESLVT